jgi:hypothetical protein
MPLFSTTDACEMPTRWLHQKTKSDSLAKESANYTGASMPLRKHPADRVDLLDVGRPGRPRAVRETRVPRPSEQDRDASRSVRVASAQ